MAEMKAKSDFKWVVYVSGFVMFVVYAFVSSFAYGTYGSDIPAGPVPANPRVQ